MKNLIKRIKFALDINYWCMSSKTRYKLIYSINEKPKTNN